MIKKLYIILLQLIIFIFIVVLCFFLLNLMGRFLDLPCRVDCGQGNIQNLSCHLDIISIYTQHLTFTGKQWCKINYFGLTDKYDSILRIIFFVILPIIVAVFFSYTIQNKFFNKNNNNLIK